MYHVKIYEQFHSSPNYVVMANKILADEIIMNKIINFYNSLPEKLKSFMKNYFSGTIDVQKFSKIERKYKIFNKIKKLYDSGIRNFKDIVDNIFPKKESLGAAGTVFLAILAVIVIGIILIFFINKTIDYGERRNWQPAWLAGVLSLVVSVVILLIVAWHGQDFINKRELEEPKSERKKEVSKEIGKILTKNGLDKDTIILIRDKDGNYKIETESDW